jgi:hypothetical protein
VHRRLQTGGTETMPLIIGEPLPVVNGEVL